MEEKKLTEEKIKKEIERRENIKKTFKVVVGREKEKWEKNAVRSYICIHKMYWASLLLHQ